MRWIFATEKRVLAFKSVLGAILVWAFLFATVRHDAHGAFARALVWSAVMLASFVGLGSLAESLTLRTERAPVALRAVWGFSAFIAFANLGVALHVGSRVWLVTWIGIGVIALGDRLRRWAPRSRPFAAAAERWSRDRTATMVCVVLVALLALRLAGTALYPDFNDNDDHIAYLPFAREIVDRGTSFQPYSFRRACVLGGQEVLHAAFLVGGDERSIRVVDGGIAVLMLALFAARARSALGKVALLALAVLLPLVRANVASENTSLVAQIGFFATLADDRYLAGRWTREILPALVLAAFASLRNTNVAPAIILVVCRPLLDPRGTAPWMRLRTQAATGAAAALFILPALVTSRLGAGTILFPLIKGNYQVAFGVVAIDPPPVAMTVAFYRVIRHTGFSVLFGMVALSTLPRTAQRLGWALVLTYLVGAATIVLRVPSADDYSITRYLFPFTAGLLAWALVVLARTKGPRLTAVLALLGLLAIQADEFRWFAMWQGRYALAIVNEMGWNATGATVAFQDDAPHPEVRAEDRLPATRYRTVQTRVPPGEPILAMVDEPSKLDFKRNPILVVDLPGAWAPPPGYPEAPTGDALAAALVAQKRRWVLVVSEGASTKAYRTATYFAAPDDPNAAMLARLEKMMNAYHALPAAARVEGDGELDLYDLSALPP